MSAPTPEAGPPLKRQSGRGFAIGLVAGVTGAAVAAVVIVGLNSVNSVPNAQSVAETPADGRPSPTPETPSENEPPLSTQDVVIRAGLGAEEVGQLLIERFDDWHNAGTNDPAVYNEWRSAPIDQTTGDFADAKAEQFAALFAAALYIDGWNDSANHPDLVKDYEFGIAVNASTLEINLITTNIEGDIDASHPADVVPFQRNILYDSAREISRGEGTRVIRIDYTESNNADQNRAGEAFAPEAATFGQPQGTMTLTLVTVDGNERIAAIMFSSR